MGRSTRLSGGEIRDVYRLMGDVRSAGLERQWQVLVDGACQLLGAEEGFFTHFTDWRIGQVPKGVMTVHSTAADARVARFTAQFYAENAVDADAMGAALYEAMGHGPGVEAYCWSEVSEGRPASAYPAFYDLTRTVRMHDILDPCMSLPDGQFMTLSLHRIGDPQGSFSARQKKLARLMAEELHWLIATGRLQTALTPTADASSSPALSPRLQEVYRLLQTDLSIKEIAYRLRLSPHTVREYVSAVYRTMGVNSRAELLIKAMQAGPGDVAPPETGG